MTRLTTLLSLLLLAGQAAAQTVYFSPHDRTTLAVVAAIDHAKTTVLVQGYGFTSEPIASAIVAAKQRGASVRVILDASNLTAKESRAPQLEAAGVNLRFDHAHAIAHSKNMIIDSAKILTGSFNWTVSAEERNAESLLILTDRELAAKYEANFERHWEHSKGRGK